MPTAMAAPHLSSLDDRKRAIRERLRSVTGHDGSLRGRLFGVLHDTDAEIIAAVWPLPGEPDLRLLMAALNVDRRVVALPVMVAPGAPLLFRAWRPGAAMMRGPLGTMHPEAGPEIDPDLVLVPAVAFDRARRRLGRGGGFYDRTLAARPGVRAIGFAHAAREVDEVPVGPHDRTLDAVVTEHEVIA